MPRAKDVTLEGASFLCNRCSVARPPGVHPCPACADVEYRIERASAPAECPAPSKAATEPTMFAFMQEE